MLENSKIALGKKSLVDKPKLYLEVMQFMREVIDLQERIALKEKSYSDPMAAEVQEGVIEQEIIIPNSLKAFVGKKMDFL